MPFPPDAVKDELDVEAVSWQRPAAVGAVTLVDVECPHARLTDNGMNQYTFRRRRERTDDRDAQPWPADLESGC